MRRRFFSASNEYLTLEPLVDGALLNIRRRKTSLPKNFYYSIDNGAWVRIQRIEDLPAHSFNAGQSIKFKSSRYDAELSFDMSEPYIVSGSVMSLIQEDGNMRKSAFALLFENSTNLISVEKTFLPATTLADYCYNSMFSGCTNLVTAPELPATTLAYRCYYCMLYGCKKLNYIKMLATDISATDCLYAWVYDVASSGTFVKNPAMTSLQTGVSGIPSGWTVVNNGEE